MARILPFAGTRYNPHSVPDMARVVAPPYDVITPEMQTRLYELDPHNVVRLILGKEKPGDDEYNNKYQRAASYLKDWKSEGVLMDDPSKHFYVHTQEFTTPDGRSHVRTGLFAAMLLEDFGKGRIRAHEHTFDGPKADRLKLLRTTRTNLSPIFCLYRDPEKATNAVFDAVTGKEKPRVEITDDDGVVHRMWPVAGAAKIKQLSALLQEKEFMIADGHHRYETALQYCREMKQGADKDKPKCPPWSYVMTYLTNCDDEGLVILPTHRVLSRDMGEEIEREELLADLAEHFELTPVRVDLGRTTEEGARLTAEIVRLGKQTAAFALVFPDGQGWFLQLKPGVDLREEMNEELDPTVARLDVAILHNYVIPQVWVGNPEIELDDHDVFYVKDAGQALDKLAAPTRASAVFLTNAPKMDEVRDITTRNLRMPHKSTYFFPKLLSGLVFRDLNAPW